MNFILPELRSLFSFHLTPLPLSWPMATVHSMQISATWIAYLTSREIKSPQKLVTGLKEEMGVEGWGK